MKWKNKSKNMMYIHICARILILSITFALNSCATPEGAEDAIGDEPKRPNILWLVCEDISPMLSMYGDSTAHTPNLDRLTQRSLVFDHAYATVGVCAPSRSSIVTGMYPISIGTMHMRTGRDVSAWGRREYNKVDENMGVDIAGNPNGEYSAVLPPEVKCFSELLRSDGYYCTNNSKTDYQFAPPITAWDENGSKAHWRNRRGKDQPFFSVFNLFETHESTIWSNSDKPLTVDPEIVSLPDYFPDTKTVRNDVARAYSNIELMDRKIGKLLDQLEEDSLLENTIIFFYSDHGGPLPRGKREHYVSGLQVPMMVSLPGSSYQRTDRMVSFVDLAPTVLSLAGVEIPSYLQGRVFLGDAADADPNMIFGSGDRFDEFTDRVRSVITKDYVYVRNFHTDKSAYKDVAYRKQIPMMMEMLTLRDEGKLNKNQMYYFRTEKEV
jgi:N-sulfoglucosamine sulfohydrolase